MIVGLVLASLARGFSGFGFSAILVTSWSIVTEPARAIALALVLEVTASIFQAFSVWNDIPWRRVAFLLGGAAIWHTLWCCLACVCAVAHHAYCDCAFCHGSDGCVASGMEAQEKSQ